MLVFLGLHEWHYCCTIVYSRGCKQSGMDGQTWGNGAFFFRPSTFVLVPSFLPCGATSCCFRHGMPVILRVVHRGRVRACCLCVHEALCCCIGFGALEVCCVAGSLVVTRLHHSQLSWFCCLCFVYSYSLCTMPCHAYTAVFRAWAALCPKPFTSVPGSRPGGSKRHNCAAVWWDLSYFLFMVALEYVQKEVRPEIRIHTKYSSVRYRVRCLVVNRCVRVPSTIV